jgi:carboxymethylenebutenolidase
MGQLDMADAVAQNIRASVDWLLRKGLSVAVAGFCMGGVLAILAGLRVSGLKAVVCFYGIPEDADPAELRVPLVGHFARNDNWVTPERVEALEARLQQGQVSYELYRYDEGHAFMNTDGPAYSERSDRLAWQRTLEFLQRHL